MRFKIPVAINEIAAMINAEIVGNNIQHATGINEIHQVETGDIVFVDHPKYYNACLNSDATFIIINERIDFPSNKTLLIVEDPFEAYQKLVNHFRPFSPSMKMISDTAKIENSTVIMPGVYIGNEVSIGHHCIIHPHVTIMDHCILGDHVIVQSGTVIGSDAFYYNKKANRDIHYNKMKNCGRVVIENDVEIGAACTIDRGVSGDTRIGAGTKLDNMVHIGHDTNVGKNCLFAAQVGIGGATIIEDNVVLWGQVGVSKTLTIGKDAIVLGKSGVTSSLEGGKTYFGFPVGEAQQKRKELVWIKRIPLLWNKVMVDK